MVYQTRVGSEGCKNKTDIRLTKGPFKNKFYNHNMSMETVKYKISTALSRYVQELKEKMRK